ncbi:hypothetical protein DdX_13557 [Ditylenchus destructor]|uniref:TIL domain-containing protein n=1 Tax=Ditylenchus destructor TaxID=166010 RepID=A0AAD4MYK1_9BILA|nr:hypothetical protein DdX_13557 [Ditylenchus destructor]
MEKFRNEVQPLEYSIRRFGLQKAFIPVAVLWACLRLTAAGPACKDNEELVHAHCDKKCERTCAIRDPNCACEEVVNWCSCKEGFVRGADENYADTDPCVPFSPFCDDKPCQIGC